MPSRVHGLETEPTLRVSTVVDDFVGPTGEPLGTALSVEATVVAVCDGVASTADREAEVRGLGCAIVSFQAAADLESVRGALG